MEGAVFSGACLRGADLSATYYSPTPGMRANRPQRPLHQPTLPQPISWVDLSGVDVRGADFTGANISGVEGLERVVADESTIWPDGFDPIAAGVVIERPARGDLSAPNVAEDLKVLAQLLNDGLLTKEEFMAAKKLTLES